LHGYYDIENRDVIYQLFGIEKDYTSLKTIEEMGDHALENIQKTLQYFREAREEEKKIMNILSPEGLQNLVDFLKEGKVFSIGNLLELPMA
jgi:ClpP class serine protease